MTEHRRFAEFRPEFECVEERPEEHPNVAARGTGGKHRAALTLAIMATAEIGGAVRCETNGYSVQALRMALNNRVLSLSKRDGTPLVFRSRVVNGDLYAWAEKKFESAS